MSDKTIPTNPISIKFKPETRAWMMEKAERDERPMTYIVNKAVEKAMAEDIASRNKESISG